MARPAVLAAACTADREDGFFELAPKLGALYHLDQRRILYASLSRGFRPPQSTELHRLQSQQQIANLDSVILDSLELGFKSIGDTLEYDVALYAMKNATSSCATQTVSTSTTARPGTPDWKPACTGRSTTTGRCRPQPPTRCTVMISASRLQGAPPLLPAMKWIAHRDVSAACNCAGLAAVSPAGSNGYMLDAITSTPSRPTITLATIC
ncbi:MAG: TonB-dependent receptor [Proteobacteria bacterium]|nr:TonB-dependent receptor [Pseudomonadota bacterium]